MQYKESIILNLIILFFLFGFQNFSIAQRTITGVLTRSNQPAAAVIVSVEGFKNLPQDTTNENGEFSITVPEGMRTLEFQEKNDHHSHRLKLNPKDTSSYLTINLDKLLGIYSWKIETSLAASSSYFSTYQSSGNNNNLSSVLAKALIHLEWKKGEYSWLTDFNLLYGQSFTKLRIEDAQGIRAASVNAKSGDLLINNHKFRSAILKNNALDSFIKFSVSVCCRL